MHSDTATQTLDPQFIAWIEMLTADFGMRAEMRMAIALYVRALAHPAADPHNLHALAAAVGASPDSFQHLLTQARWSSRLLHHALRHALRAVPHLQWQEHPDRVLVIQATSSHKRGTHLPYVGRQDLPPGSRRDLGRVTLLSFWSDGTTAYPLHLAPVTPPNAPGSTATPTRSRIAWALHLCVQAGRLAMPEHIVVGDLLTDGAIDLADALDDAAIDYVLTMPLHRAYWPTRALQPLPRRSPHATARRLPVSAWHRIPAHAPDDPTWFVAELLPWPAQSPGLTRPRLLVLTTVPESLPRATTLAISTNLSPHIRNPVAVGQHALLRQPADRWLHHAHRHLGFDAYQGRSRLALHRHNVLVCVAAAWPLVQPYVPPASAPASTVGRRMQQWKVVSTRSSALTEILRRFFGYPSDHAVAVARRIARRSRLSHLVLHWNRQHALPADNPAVEQILTLLGSTPLLPLQALSCLASGDPVRAVQRALGPLPDLDTTGPAVTLQVYCAQTRLAVGAAHATRSATGVLTVAPEGEVYEQDRADRRTLAYRLGRLLGHPSDRATDERTSWQHWNTYESKVLGVASERWTLVLWREAVGTGAWELVGETRPAGLDGIWDGGIPGTLFDRRWVVDPATLELAADWILHGAVLRKVLRTTE